MKQEDAISALIAVLIVAFVWCLAFSKGGKCEREDAIKSGVAYYTNNAAGESVFKWKECK